MTLFSDILSIPSNPEDFFTLISPIGSGAFGRVYKAIHNESKKIYAIKIIQYFKEEINYIDNNNHIDNINFCYKTVQQETSLMRLVNSSNYILKYYGSYFSRKTNTLWLIIEYCSSGSAIDLMLAMDRTYTEIELATIIKMTLKGLIIIHNKNLIHRDIKGANILLSEEGYAKLGDFGVGAELKEAFRTSKKGSPYWMSPQVIKKEKYDYKTDIWSLGITCIELLQGEPPNSGLSPEGVMQKIGNKLFKFEDFFGGEKNKYSKEFQNFLFRCLDVNPLSRANAKELINHPFIIKYSKDNLFLKKLLIKHKNDIEIYRKEVEEFENQMRNNKIIKNELKIKNNYTLKKSIKKGEYMNKDKDKDKDKKNLKNDVKDLIKNENEDIHIFKQKKESELNDSFFNCLKIRNNAIIPGNYNFLSNLSSHYNNSKRKSNISNEYSKSKHKNSDYIEDINIPIINYSINMSVRNTKNKIKMKNNSFISSNKKKITKSRNTNKYISKERKCKNKLYFTKNEYILNKNKKCQIISFRMSMKKSISEKKNNNSKNNNIIYNRKIVLNQGKNKISYDKRINKIKSHQNLKVTNSNINTDFNTDNLKSNNNNQSFIINSLSLKNIINKTKHNENIKNIKLNIQTLSHVENNKIKNDEYIFNDITDYNLTNNCTSTLNRISTDVNAINYIDEIPSLNFGKILNNNTMDKIGNILIKEENINDNDDDCLINKINNYKLNINETQDKENKNALNYNYKKINNNIFDTIHSYSIIDSKDSIISTLPINSSNINLKEPHKGYFV